ncbi:MAG TPA: substrate-binding domain-containing protein [Pirellulaceae bacterium]|nr:substrate-binding domain-containing protein [Pirellulaceae bacterium]
MKSGHRSEGNVGFGFRRSLLLAVLLFGLAGCGAKEESSGTGGGGDRIRIAVIPKGASHQFWQSVHYGAQQAADELGNIDIVWQSPAIESDTGKQIELVLQMVAQDVDAIVLAPNHQGSLVDAVREANASDIPVAIFDSGLDEGAEIVTYVATDNRNGGRLAARRLAEVLDGKGEVILLRYKEGSESTFQREEGFLEEMAAFPEIKVVSSDEYGGDSVATAKAKVQQLVQRFPNAVGLFAVCESNANGALEALLESDSIERVKFVGFDPSERLIEALKEGTCQGLVLQDPVKMGYESVKALARHMEGQRVETFVGTGEAVAKPENVTDPRIEQLLHPPTLK